MDLTRLFETINSDVDVCLPGSTEIRERRSSWLASAFHDPAFDQSPRTLLGYEFFAKCGNLPGITPKLAWPQYQAIQQTPPSVSASDLILDSVSSAMHWILGKYDSIAVADLCRHGPGVVTEHLHGYDKWLFSLPYHHHLTDKCDPLARLSRGSLSFTNLFTEIPKTSWTNRGIAIEGAASQFLQQGIGRLMRRRFISNGVDLSNSWKKNISLIHDSSFHSVDLSAASDSVTIGLVSLLCDRGHLPEWYASMMSVRSVWTIGPDLTVVPNETLASMGNGFSFTLLSLISFAACIAAIHHNNPRYCNRRHASMMEFHHNCSVFGDDIVVHESLLPSLRYVLASLGFSVNTEKSSGLGPLRESCGTFILHTSRDKQPFVYSSIPRLRDYHVRTYDGLIDLCNLQRSCVRHHMYDTGSYLLDTIRKHDSKRRLVIVGTDVPENVLSDSLVVYQPARVTSHRWSQRRQTAYQHVVGRRFPSRDSDLGDSVGWGATLYSGIPSQISPEKCGNVSRLCSRNVHYPALG